MIRKDTAVSAVVRSGALPTRALWTTVDAVIWVMALYLAAWMRLEFSITPEYWYPLLVASALVVFCHVSIGWFRGPYGIGYDLASFEETSDLAGTAVLSGVTLGFLVVALNAIELPRSVPFTGLAMAMAGMFAARFLIRSRRTHRAIAAISERRAVVFGAGAGGRILVQSLVRGPGSSLLPVALLDDDPRKARLFIEGVRVRGTRADLARVAERHQANTVVIAAPSATPEVVRELSAVARDCGLEVLVLPPFREILDGRPTESDLRNLDVADLLGRQPVDLDMSAITNEISGRRVLVTGAGGSIGSELCRQLMRFGPDRLYMLDRDESGLHSTQLSLDGRALLDTDELVLCDIRDAEAVTRAFRQARPDVVFHAAALKHLTMLERHPDEALQDQRRRQPQRARGRPVRRRADLRQHLHGQGGATDLRPRLVQAGRRAPHRRVRRIGWRAVRQRPLRERPGLSRLGGSCLSGADPPRRTCHGHSSRGRALLHAHPGGVPARSPGRSDRDGRRGDGAGHGHPRTHRRRGPDDDRALRSH